MAAKEEIMDPLGCVRQWVRRGSSEAVDLAAERIELVGQSFSRDQPTAFRKRNTENEYYTLVEVLFYAMHRDKGVSEYTREAMARQIGRVVFLDQANLKSYLLGEIDECREVDEQKIEEYRSGRGHERKRDEISGVSTGTPSGRTHLSAAVMEKRREHAAMLDDFLEAARKGAVTDSTGYMEHKIDTQLIDADRSLLQSLRATELPLVSSTTVMHRPGANLAEETLRWYQESVKAKHQPSGAAAPNHPHGAAAVSAASAKRARDSAQGRSGAKRRVTGPPIIIVPNSLTGVISSVNARDLLEDAQFISIAAKKQQGGKREPRIQISRVVDGQTRVYEVVDDGKRLSESEWERVVAVFASGEQWQFKSWKWSEPVELFQHVLGLHAMFDVDQIRPTVASWNVRIVKVSNTRRHLDSTAYSDIWRDIDHWMERNARHLLAAAAPAAQAK